MIAQSPGALNIRQLTDDMILPLITGGSVDAQTNLGLLREFIVLFSGQTSPKFYGARGDGVTDDTAAVLAALNSGMVVDGGGLTYAVAGTVAPSSFVGLQNITLKQIAPATVNVRTLWIPPGASGFFLHRVKIDMGGNFTVPANINYSAGLFVGYYEPSAATSNFLLEEVEAYNGGALNGIMLANCTDFEMHRCYVHDLTFHLTPDPTDDSIQGIALFTCERYSIVACEVEDLTGYLAGVPITTYSRGFAIGNGGSNGTFVDCVANNVDQGYDFTGTGDLDAMTLSSCLAISCSAVGFKFSNHTHYSSMNGCIANGCGQLGFLVVGVDTGRGTQFISLTGCIALDTGKFNPRGLSGQCGFQIVNADANTDPTWPRAVKLANCIAVDTQTVPTMLYGFYSNTTGIPPNTTGYNTDQTISLNGCHSYGHTISATLGAMLPLALIRKSANQSINDSTYTAVSWNTEDADTSALFNTSFNAFNIYVKEPGLYDISSVVVFAANATGARRARILYNGTPVQEIIEPGGNGTDNTYVSVSYKKYLKEGENIRVEAWQNSGGALNIIASLGYLSVCKVG